VACLEDAGRRRRVLCAGIAVLDDIFQVAGFPPPGAKIRASAFVSVPGGCAANAAVAVARLGGAATYAGPLGGPAGQDPVSDRILAALAREGIDCSGCVRVSGASSPHAVICVDAGGERTIVTYRDDRISSVAPCDPDALVANVDAVHADNRLPAFTLPVCRAAGTRGVPVVLDVDRATTPDDPLLTAASHVVFSADSLRATAGTDDLRAALASLAAVTPSIVAVTAGEGPILWRDRTGAIHAVPACPVAAVDTLAAGDVFHGAMALALAEGRGLGAARRFAAAAAALKCTRFGGAAAIPRRDEVDRFLIEHP
jgi:sulfofructose kinase